MGEKMNEKSLDIGSADSWAETEGWTTRLGLETEGVGVGEIGASEPADSMNNVDSAGAASA